MKNIHQWIQHLEETLYFNWTPSQLVQFFVEQFRDRNSALLNLDYALMDIYTSSRDGQFDNQSEYLVTEARKIGYLLLKHLEKLGCFSKERLDYCFAKEIDTDTFLLWRPDAADIH